MLLKVIAYMNIVLAFHLNSLFCIIAFDTPKFPIKEIGEELITLRLLISNSTWTTFCFDINGALCFD